MLVGVSIFVEDRMTLMKYFVFFFIVATTAYSDSLDDFIEWQDYSLLYIWGDGYKINPNDQHTLSLEHVSKTTFGNTYFFTDFTRYNHSDEPEGLYGEATVRFSYNKIFNKDFLKSKNLPIPKWL